MGSKNKSWRTVRGQRPLDEERIAAYGRLMELDARLEELRRRHRIDPAKVPTISNSIAEEDDVYLGALTRYVAALGGQLEVRAVFPDETVTLLREPEIN